MNLIDRLESHDVTYTDACACGGEILMGTDGNGHATECCLACGAFTETPRLDASAHTLIAGMEEAFAQEVAAMRAAIEAERTALAICPDCQARRVSSFNATRCAECAQERRRTQSRLAMRAKGAHAARVV